MFHPAVGALPKREVDVGGERLMESSPRMAPLAEAKGVMRDVLAAIRNLEHLLRSPRVGPRALGQVIPGLKGLCDPLLVAVDEIIRHVAAHAKVPVQDSLDGLRVFVREVCDCLRAALDKAAGVALDAKSRLSFEAAIVRAGADLNSVRQLLDLLIRATESSDTDLFVEELIQATFSPPLQRGGRPALVKVVASYVDDGSGFQASPQVLMPLIAAAIGLSWRPPSDRVFVTAACRQGEAVRITVSSQALASVGGAGGTEESWFEPPMLIGPSLHCLQAAARLASGTFDVSPDTVVISWPHPTA